MASMTITLMWNIHLCNSDFGSKQQILTILGPWKLQNGVKIIKLLGELDKLRWSGRRNTIEFCWLFENCRLPLHYIIIISIVLLCKILNNNKGSGNTNDNIFYLLQISHGSYLMFRLSLMHDRNYKEVLLLSILWKRKVQRDQWVNATFNKYGIRF